MLKHLIECKKSAYKNMQKNQFIITLEEEIVKKMFKGLAVLLAAMMPLSLMACGAKNQDPKAVVEKAVTASAEMKSYHADMDIVLDMTVKGENQAQNITVSMDAFTDPVKLKMEMAVAGQNMEMYADADYSYINMGQWVKMPLESANMQQTDAKANMDMYLKNMDNFKLDGEEQVSGLDTYKISGVISGKSLEEVIQQSGALDQIRQLGLDADQTNMVENMMKDMQDVPVTIWVEKKDYLPVQYDIDMTNVMAGMMKNMEGQLKDEIGEGNSIEDFMKIDEYSMRMTMSQINEIEDFEIPAEALAGMDASALTEAAQ